MKKEDKRGEKVELEKVFLFLSSLLFSLSLNFPFWSDQLLDILSLSAPLFY